MEESGFILETYTIDDFIIENYSNIIQVCNLLKNAMQIRFDKIKELHTLLENSSAENKEKVINMKEELGFLLENEFESEKQAYELFWGENASQISIFNKVNNFFNWCQHTYPEFSEFVENNKNCFYYMYVKQNKEISNIIITDNHTSKILPICISNCGLLSGIEEKVVESCLNNKKEVVYYLGDTLDRAILPKIYSENNFRQFNQDDQKIEESSNEQLEGNNFLKNDFEKEKKLFLFKKYCTLFMIKLFKMIELYEHLFLKTELRKQTKMEEKFFAVLGNHDFGPVLWNDLVYVFNLEEDNFEYIESLKNLFDILVRFFIPVELVVQTPFSLDRFTHSGGSVPLKESYQKKLQKKIKNIEEGAVRVCVNLKVSEIENEETHIDYEKLKTMERMENIIHSLSSEKDNPFQTWCILYPNTNPGLYYHEGNFSCGANEVDLFKKWNQENYGFVSKINDYRGHQHDTREMIPKYFLNNGEFDGICCYLNEKIEICSFKKENYISFFPPVGFDNLYYNEYFSKLSLEKQKKIVNDCMQHFMKHIVLKFDLDENIKQLINEFKNNNKFDSNENIKKLINEFKNNNKLDSILKFKYFFLFLKQ